MGGRTQRSAGLTTPLLLRRAASLPPARARAPSLRRSHVEKPYPVLGRRVLGVVEVGRHHHRDGVAHKVEVGGAHAQRHGQVALPHAQIVHHALVAWELLQTARPAARRRARVAVLLELVAGEEGGGALSGVGGGVVHGNVHGTRAIVLRRGGGAGARSDQSSGWAVHVQHFPTARGTGARTRPPCRWGWSALPRRQSST